MALGVSETLAGLVDGAYAAALDDTLWAPWADRLIEALGGSAGSFAILDRATAKPRHLNLIRQTDKTAEEYFDEMWALDPQLPFAISNAWSGVYLDTDHVDLDNKMTAEFTRWVTGNVKVRHHMTWGARLGGGRIRAGVCIHRGVADGATPVEEQEKLAAILPEITRAMSLGFTHAEKLQDAWWSGLSQGRQDLALLLDDGRRVLRTTPALVEVLRREGALDITRGCLRAADPAVDGRLQAVLARAAARVSPVSGALRLERSAGGAPLILTAFPLPRAGHLLASARAAVLVTLVDPQAVPSPPAELWRQAFGLTAREAELAALLTLGHSVESAAARLAITRGTARIHLRHLFAKTQTTRQTDLIRLLMRVG